VGISFFFSEKKSSFVILRCHVFIGPPLLCHLWQIMSRAVVNVLFKYCAVLLLIAWYCMYIYRNISDHLQSGVVYNFGRFRLSVFQMITFRSLDMGSSYLHIRCISKFVNEGHRVKVKVTGAKKRSTAIQYPAAETWLPAQIHSPAV